MLTECLATRWGGLRAVAALAAEASSSSDVAKQSCPRFPGAVAAAAGSSSDVTNSSDVSKVAGAVEAARCLLASGTEGGWGSSPGLNWCLVEHPRQARVLHFATALAELLAKAPELLGALSQHHQAVFVAKGAPEARPLTPAPAPLQRSPLGGHGAPRILACDKQSPGAREEANVSACAPAPARPRCGHKHTCTS